MTGVQTCALPIYDHPVHTGRGRDPAASFSGAISKSGHLPVDSQNAGNKRESVNDGPAAGSRDQHPSIGAAVPGTHRRIAKESGSDGPVSVSVERAFIP